MVVDEGGTAQMVVEEVPGGPPSGLGWLPDGRLLLVAAEGQSLLSLEPDGTLAPHADLSGATTHWCNELVLDASGRADPEPALLVSDEPLRTSMSPLSASLDL